MFKIARASGPEQNTVMETPGRRKNTPSTSAEQANDEGALVSGALARVSRWLETLPPEERRKIALGITVMASGCEGIEDIHARFVERETPPRFDLN